MKLQKIHTFEVSLFQKDTDNGISSDKVTSKLNAEGWEIIQICSVAISDTTYTDEHSVVVTILAEKEV